ncbi:uncharacterized protein LOC117650509 isoform X2 [Thrips palmi]|uniref:Uncharacterized protein LOC117650509 isoform X2 n=1 Tax=Thrips palmi TaxID=161013 RepID=A0A6P8ZWW2_THRPL|nr:uncharacterized protein LOC117650509 isoform X2 [Thrips palmi]
MLGAEINKTLSLQGITFEKTVGGMVAFQLRGKGVFALAEKSEVASKRRSVHDGQPAWSDLCRRARPGALGTRRSTACELECGKEGHGLGRRAEHPQPARAGPASHRTSLPAVGHRGTAAVARRFLATARGCVAGPAGKAKRPVAVTFDTEYSVSAERNPSSRREQCNRLGSLTFTCRRALGMSHSALDRIQICLDSDRSEQNRIAL